MDEVKGVSSGWCDPFETQKSAPNNKQQKHKQDEDWTAHFVRVRVLFSASSQKYGAFETGIFQSS